MSKKIIKVSDATFRAIAAQHGFVVTEPKAQKQYQSPLAVGDTVRVIRPECSGLVGELKTIDMEEPDENFFGVRIDEIEGWIFFRADELERVEPVKYIRFNASYVTRPTWVHIASGEPFALKPRRYGRWSSTACGKEYEMDDYTVIKDEQEAKSKLCKSCAKAAGIASDRSKR